MEHCKAQRKYDSSIQEKKTLEEKKEIIESLRSRLLLDYSQNESETGYILSTCKRPIRRHADSNEIKSIHALKERKSKILTDLKHLNHDEQSINMELMRCNQLTDLSTKNLEDSIQNLKAAQGIEEEIHNDKFGLPMVVGRSIGNVMNPLESRPWEVFNIIVQKSRYELIRHQVENALLLQKETLKESEKIWNSKLTWINEKSEYERFLGRLSTATDRLKKATVPPIIFAFETSIKFRHEINYSAITFLLFDTLFSDEVTEYMIFIIIQLIRRRSHRSAFHGIELCS